MNVAENVCRFKGILTSYELKQVGNDGYTLGKGIVFLPIASGKGQEIKIVAWDPIASLIQEAGLNVWVEVVCCYTPELWRNTLFDNFTVGVFKVLRNE